MDSWPGKKHTLPVKGILASKKTTKMKKKTGTGLRAESRNIMLKESI